MPSQIRGKPGQRAPGLARIAAIRAGLQEYRPRRPQRQHVPELAGGGFRAEREHRDHAAVPRACE
ncbi:MAG TPA: hypothetical protein VKS82_23305 [Streptosporangiaceae bacterium]|nr:hypothetical protein [Streptosporangiaceae bacterium]